MKVLHLITGLARGGAETMLGRLAPLLAREGIGAAVVSLTDAGSIGPELRASGIEVTALGMARGRPSPAALLRLAGLFRRERPDLVQTWLYHADLLGLAVKTLVPGLPLIWNLRCSDMNLADYGRGTRVVRQLLARAARLPAAVIVNSEAGRRYHAALGYRPKRWELIPNGFDTERFRPDDARRQGVRQQLGIRADQPLVGMVARVDPMKDHANFLAMAAQVASQLPEVRFLLIGAGTDLLALPACVQALGERSDIAPLLPALDLLVLSSAFGEGFPNAIGEAMASGVPAIATDVGDAAAIIGDSGAVVPPRDASALATAVLGFLARDPATRAALGVAARQRIEAHFALPAIVQRYAQLYREIVGRR